MKKKLMTLLLVLTAATALGTLAACGEAHEHTYGEWEIVITPTTTQTGLITRTCTEDSSHKESAILPALNSVDYTMVETEATCTVDGGIYYTLNDDSYLIDGERIVISILDGSQATGHNLSHTEATEATCTTDGNAEYWYCDKCGTYFTDEAATSETTLADVTIAAAGHTLTHYEAVAATCTATGNSEYWYCADCGEYFSDAEGTTATTLAAVTIAKTEHTYGSQLTYSGGKWYKTCSVCSDAVEVTDTDGYTRLADSADALASALSLGGDICLTANISGTAAYGVASGATATLDLNGKTVTLSSAISIAGNLTVKDSGTGGKIEASSTIIAQVESGCFTLDGGTLSSSGNYGIYCLDGGTATINGGTISCYYAPLSGNNTTGDMNFIVNGGTLTATYGPAIYMPGQVVLTITGGTIDGGISLRMGIVNISGGTINAITDNIDSITQYYDYSGNVWLADALYVMAGTYTSTNAAYGNKLELNITGGTFNCANGQGSAVAIYDLGRVEQSITVNITGGTLTTNSTARSAYQVLSLDDMGVTDANYGTYSGNVTTTINVGTATELAAAVAAGSAVTNISLTADIEITATAFAGSIFASTAFTIADTDIIIDVAGYVLTITGNQTLFVTNGNSLTFTDSTNASGSASTAVKLYLNTTSSSNACLNIQSGSTVTMKNIVVSSTGSVLYPKGDAAAVNVIDSRIITSGVYGVSTNAATADNYGVVITISDSYLETTAADSDSCVVMINIPGTMTISGSTIVGQRQGVIARGGTVSISDTTISTAGTYTGSYYLDTTWGSGNEVPLAALVVGNNASAYQYATTITLSNVTLAVDDGANANAVTMYVYGNSSSELGVTLTYNSGCSLGSYTVGGGYVTVNNSQVSPASD